MKLSRVMSTGLVLMIFCIASALAAALDAPQNVHHTKLQARLKQTNRSTAHRSTSHTAKPAATSAAHAAASASATTHATTFHTSATQTHTATAHAPAKTVAARKTTRGAATPRVRRVSITRRHRYYERFKASSFVQGAIGVDDVTAGEDPVVRQAAIDALGDMNGTALVIDPSNGRILAMVNQKLALSPGAEPCSTIKLTVALAALSEGLVTRDTMVQLPGFRMNMTQALAKSNNLYFEEMGRELGFDRVRHYATQFGLGELAGYNIAGEQLGEYPDQAIPESAGGVGRMCSFGQGVSMTPLQLGAIVAAIANGGTLYYLQHPTTPEEVAAFEPKVKRTLDIARYAPELEDGMAGAVEYGTARWIARQLPRAAGVWQNRNLLRQWDALWLVRLVFQFAAGQPGDRVLPRGRQADLRPARCRAYRRVLQEPLGPRLLRGEEPGSAECTGGCAGNCSRSHACNGHPGSGCS